MSLRLAKTIEFSLGDEQLSVCDLEELFDSKDVERNLMSPVNCDCAEILSRERDYVVRITHIDRESFVKMRGDGRLPVLNTYVFFDKDRESDARHLYESGDFRSERFCVIVGSEEVIINNDGVTTRLLIDE